LVDFAYTSPLLTGKAISRGSFLAGDGDGRKLVVKFAERCEEAHELFGS
jgi:hypothetical protein